MVDSQQKQCQGETRFDTQEPRRRAFSLITARLSQMRQKIMPAAGGCFFYDRNLHSFGMEMH